MTNHILFILLGKAKIHSSDFVGQICLGDTFLTYFHIFVDLRTKYICRVKSNKSQFCHS